MLGALSLLLAILAGAPLLASGFFPEPHKSFPGSRTVFTEPIGAAPEAPEEKAKGNPREVVLRFNYRVSCDPGESLRGLTGSITYQLRTIRFDLFSATDHTDVALGKVSGPLEYVHIAVDPSPDCELTQFAIEDRPVRPGGTLYDLVLRHSPFLVIRGDQYKNRVTDLPIALAYSTLPMMAGAAQHLLIKYTVFFTDEDSLPGMSDTEAQMARYGRRTDIEWLYQVELDLETGAVVSRQYQGGAVGEIGHARYFFVGQYLPESDHPILYDTATHNIFDDVCPPGRREAPLVGYHLVPDPQYGEIEFPRAREELMLAAPWMFEVSDEELNRERKLAHPFDEYLFVLVDGELRQGAFTILISPSAFERGRALSSLTDYRSGGGASDIDRLGEDLWGRRTLSAIPVPRGLAAQLGERLHGELRLQQSSFSPVRFRLRELRFFLVQKDSRTGKPATEDVTSRFQCRYRDMQTRCRF